MGLLLFSWLPSLVSASGRKLGWTTSLPQLRDTTAGAVGVGDGIATGGEDAFCEYASQEAHREDIRPLVQVVI